MDGLKKTPRLLAWGFKSDDRGPRVLIIDSELSAGADNSGPQFYTRHLYY